MPLIAVKGFAAKIRDLLFRHEDKLAHELLLKTGDDEAIQVIDSLPPAEKLRMFRMMPSDRRARVLVKLGEYSREVVAAALSTTEVMNMVAVVESDEAVDVIQQLAEPLRAQVIAELRKGDSHGILPLLVFGEETAGGIMKTELLKFSQRTTVDEARKLIARMPGTGFKTNLLYVTGEADALVGTITPIQLIRAATDLPLAAVMQSAPVAVPPTMDQEEVVNIFDEQNAVEVPVVDAKGKLLGCITADDVFTVMEKEYSEDITRLTGADEDESVTDPILLTVRRRLPWLLVNLATAILAAWVVTLFQDTIQRAVILAAYMPIIAGMGGNAATQTLGVVVRSIALGELHNLNTLATVAKNIAAGTLTGLATGVVMAAISWWWSGNIMLAFVILAAMTANLFIAGLGGALIPVVMKRMRIDPALASTVFVTTLTDICGFFVFLGLASILL